MSEPGDALAQPGIGHQPVDGAPLQPAREPGRLVRGRGQSLRQGGQVGAPALDEALKSLQRIGEGVQGRWKDLTPADELIEGGAGSAPEGIPVLDGRGRGVARLDAHDGLADEATLRRVDVAAVPHQGQGPVLQADIHGHRGRIPLPDERQVPHPAGLDASHPYGRSLPDPAGLTDDRHDVHVAAGPVDDHVEVEDQQGGQGEHRQDQVSAALPSAVLGLVRHGCGPVQGPGRRPTGRVDSVRGRRLCCVA